MKIPWLFLVISFAFTSACKKSMPAYAATGFIIGSDPRVPACGGGTWIEIDGHPNPNNPTTGYYDMGSVPTCFRIPSSSAYPVKVELDYLIDTHCPQYVDISRIQIIK